MPVSIMWGNKRRNLIGVKEWTREELIAIVTEFRKRSKRPITGDDVNGMYEEDPEKCPGLWIFHKKGGLRELNKRAQERIQSALQASISS